MTFDLSPGDVVHIGNSVTLIVLAVEGDLIHFKLQSPEGECPGTGMDCEEADFNPKQRWWEHN